MQPLSHQRSLVLLGMHAAQTAMGMGVLGSMEPQKVAVCRSWGVDVGCKRSIIDGGCMSAIC